VWLTRLLTIILVRLARRWGVELCPNYVISVAALEQQQQDLYIAHELVQMVPISGLALYNQMRKVNAWANGLMPNAQGTFHLLEDRQPQGLWRRVQQAAEWLLAGRFGNLLEAWERRRKARKLSAEIRADSAVKLDDQQVKGHFRDYGRSILDRFQMRLREHQLEE
jgi:hypothetical protein